VSIKAEKRIQRLLVNPFAGIACLVAAYYLVGFAIHLVAYLNLIVFLFLYAVAAFVIYGLELFFMDHSPSAKESSGHLGWNVIVSIVVLLALAGAWGMGFVGGIFWDYEAVSKTISVLMAIISFAGMFAVWSMSADTVPISKQYP